MFGAWRNDNSTIIVSYNTSMPAAKEGFVIMANGSKGVNKD